MYRDQHAVMWEAGRTTLEAQSTCRETPGSDGALPAKPDITAPGVAVIAAVAPPGSDRKDLGRRELGTGHRMVTSTIAVRPVAISLPVALTGSCAIGTSAASR